MALGRIDDLAIENRSISPHGDFTCLEQRHDILPGHVGNASWAIIGEHLAIESDGIERFFGIEDRFAFVEVRATIIIHIA